MSHLKKVYAATTESIDFISLNHDIASAIKETGAASGVVHVVVPKSGAGLLVFENLPEVRDAVMAQLESCAQDGEVQDKLRRAVPLAPRIQTAFLPRSFACPFSDHALLLAPYEEVLLVDCEPRSQRREVIVAIMPEAEAAPE